MKCRHVNLLGQSAIICGDFHDLAPSCGVCTEPGDLLCDWIIEKGTPHAPGRTCDRRICRTHALEVGPEKHLCPEHQAAYAQWKAQREKLTGGGARP